MLFLSKITFWTTVGEDFNIWIPGEHNVKQKTEELIFTSF